MPRYLAVASAAAAAALAALTLQGCGGGGGGGDDPCVFDGSSDTKKGTYSVLLPKPALKLILSGFMTVDVVFDPQAKNITAEMTTTANIFKDLEAYLFEDFMYVKQKSACAKDADGAQVRLTLPGAPQQLAVNASTATVPRVTEKIGALDGAKVTVDTLGPSDNYQFLINQASMWIGTAAIDNKNMVLQVLDGSQLFINKSDGVAARADLTVSGSRVSMNVDTGRLDLIGHNSSFYFRHCNNAYLKMDEDMTVDIVRADGKVVECSSGKDVTIGGDPTIVEPDQAKSDPFCAGSVTV